MTVTANCPGSLVVKTHIIHCHCILVQFRLETFVAHPLPNEEMQKYLKK